MVLPDGSLFGEGVKTRLKEHLMEECNLHTIVRLPNSVFKPYACIGTNLLFFEKGEPTKDIWFYEHRVPEGQKAYSMTKPIRVEHLQACIDWWGGAEAQGPRGDAEVAWKVTAEEVKARGYNLDIKNPHTVADDHGDPEELLAKLDEAEQRDGRAARPAQGDPGGGAAAMNPAQLLAHFERISDAPDAIPRLRRFILDLAVRGKLVEQDPKDEPASELLKRIETEKARLVKAQRRSGSARAHSRSVEVPFRSSDQAGSRFGLGQLARKLGAGMHRSAGSPSTRLMDVPLLDPKTFTSRRTALDDVALIASERFTSRATYSRSAADDHRLLNIDRRIDRRCAARACRLSSRATVSQHVAIDSACCFTALVSSFLVADVAILAERD